MDHKNLIPGLPDEIGLECLVRVPYRYHSELKSVCKAWNGLLSDTSYYRHRKAAGKAEDLVCLVQAAAVADPFGKKLGKTLPAYGLTVYNAADGSWTRLPSPPSLPAGIPLFSQCVAVAGKVVVLGGWDPATLDSVADVYVYDFASGGGGWRRGASMGTARSFFACAAVAGVVYVAGGHDDRKNALRSAEAYDVEADTWRRLPDMLSERDECQGFAGTGEGRFVVVSGYSTDSQGRFGSTAEVFDPDRCEWTLFEGAWPYPNNGPRASSVLAPSDLKKGQTTGMPFTRLWTIEGGSLREYEYGSRSWKVVGPAPDGVQSSSCLTLLHGSGSLPERLFLSGSGCLEDGRLINMGYVMDIRTLKWVRVDITAKFSGFVFSASSLDL